MSNLNRRTFLSTGAAVAAVNALPRPAKAIAPQAAIAPTPAMPSWCIGQDDSWNWKPIKAATEREARIRWMSLTDGTNGECEEGGPFKPDCECQECSTYFSLDVRREPEWDGKRVAIGDEHWFSSGMGSSCSRCSDEAYLDMGANFVSGSVVCMDCMTLVDWEVVDPDIAAEMRAELEDDPPLLHPSSTASTADPDRDGRERT